jgi:predicted amidohydrolase YtcJ
MTRRISRALDVFEKVQPDIPIHGLNWFFDHAETISDRSIDRIAALGGGIAVQHRMAYQGEYFVERYGTKAAEAIAADQAHAGGRGPGRGGHRRNTRCQL